MCQLPARSPKPQFDIPYTVVELQIHVSDFFVHSIRKSPDRHTFLEIASSLGIGAATGAGAVATFLEVDIAKR